MGNRIGVFFSLAASTRLVTSTSSSPPIPALDPGTGLYYTTTVNADGSGEQFLYVDQALTEPAGFFKWSKPKWATSTPGTYPATISVAYSIIAGNYSGVSGTMTITVNDPNFKNGLIELALSDSLHESASASLALSAEGISGEDKMKLSNGDSCTVSDSTSAAGVLIQVFSYPDGSTEDIDSSPDGTSTETYTNPDGTTAAPDLSGSVQPDGSDTIDSSSGDTQTVNVDPGDSGDDSGDSGGDSSGGDATDQAVIRKAAAKPSTGSAGAPPAAAQIRK
jgi:hypothetical protein